MGLLSRSAWPFKAGRSEDFINSFPSHVFFNMPEPVRYSGQRGSLPERSGQKVLSRMAGTLIPLATFAGGITIAAQFIIICPESRLQALPALASQLFLAT